MTTHRSPRHWSCCSAGGSCRQCCESVFIWSGFGSSILGWIPIRIQGFVDQKLTKIYNKNKYFVLFFKSKTTIYPIPRPPQRTSKLQKEAFKRTSSTSKHEIFKFFLLLSVIFALLDPDSESGSTDPIETGSHSDPDPQPLPVGVVLQRLFGLEHACAHGAAVGKCSGKMLTLHMVPRIL